MSNNSNYSNMSKYSNTLKSGVYIIVIYDVITVDYCKCILLYSPLNSYLYVHWILDFK